jgi:transcriptional regulator with XRE-family HTH domain
MEGSTLARRQLGARLKRLREAAGKTLADVETAGVASPSKLWRIESGRTSVRTGDVRDLCVLYRSDQDLDGLLALARASKEGTWWEPFTLRLAGFGLYLDLEASATTIHTYDAELIHGLLQTPEYHRAISLAERSLTDEEMTHAEGLRQRRLRASLDRPDPCHMTAIIGEAALHQQVGSADLLQEQIAHLRARVASGPTEVRVVPWTVGAHVGLSSGPFTVLDFASGDDPDVVYLENLTEARYLETPAHMQAYRRTWRLLTQRSVPLEEYLA